MRPFFVVGAKLIGLLVLYWATQHLGLLLGSVRLLWTQLPADAPSIDPIWNLFAVSVSFLVAIAFGLFLLFRGDRLASLIPLPQLPVSAAAIRAGELLQAGIVVAGLLVACTAVPKFVLEAFVILTGDESASPVVTVYGQSRIVESGIQLVLAWLLIFRSSRIAHLIDASGVERQSGAETAEPAVPADAAKGPPRR